MVAMLFFSKLAPISRATMPSCCPAAIVKLKTIGCSIFELQYVMELQDGSHGGHVVL